MKFLILVGIALWAFATPVFAESPPDFEIVYRVYDDDGSGIGELIMRSRNQSADALLLDAEFTPKNIIGLLFSGVHQLDVEADWRDGRIIPQRWVHTSGKEKIFYRLDAQNFLISVIGDEQPYELPLNAPSAFELISMHVQLAMDMKTAPAMVFYDTVSGHRLRRYVFMNKGTEILTTTLGKIETIRMDGFKKGELRYHYWLSPAHQNLVVQAHFVKDGELQYTVNAVAVEAR